MEKQNELVEWIEKHKILKPWLFFKYIYNPHPRVGYRLHRVLRWYVGEQVIADFFKIKDSVDERRRARNAER